MAQCCTGFEEGGFLSDTVSGNVSSEVFYQEIALKNRKGEGFIAPHPSQEPRRMGHPLFCFPGLLADAELSNDRFIALGIVSLKIVEQATPLADQHEQAAARAVVLLVRFEVVRQLANAFTDDGDLNLGTPRVSRVRLVPVNDGFLLLSG